MVTKAPASIARYLDPDFKDAIKSIPRDKPFRISQVNKTSITSSSFAATLKKYDLARRLQHNNGHGRFWVLTEIGIDLVRYLNDEHPREKPKPRKTRVPKYISPIREILSREPASKAALARELGVYPPQLKPSLRYLQQNRIAIHKGTGTNSRWELAQDSS